MKDWDSIVDEHGSLVWQTAYPHCFRDNIGLRSLPPGLIAKTYADSRGITVTYYAKEQVTGELEVDGSTLGHPQMGVRRHSIDLKLLEAGYVVLLASKP